MSDDQLTRDVSPCEHIIVRIKTLQHLMDTNQLDSKQARNIWNDIDRIRPLCDVLPKEFQLLLVELEQYRPR